jgi:hypothetical protein
MNKIIDFILLSLVGFLATILSFQRRVSSFNSIHSTSATRARSDVSRVEAKPYHILPLAVASRLTSLSLD